MPSSPNRPCSTGKTTSTDAEHLGALPRLDGDQAAGGRVGGQDDRGAVLDRGQLRGR